MNARKILNGRPSLFSWVCLLLLLVLPMTACRKATSRPSEPAAPAIPAPTVEAERGKFQGTWRYVSLDFNGQMVAPAIVREHQYKFEGTRYSNSRNGREVLRGTFTIDPSHSPAWLDLIENSRIANYGIYRFDGERLTICLHEKQRPTVFASSGGPGYIVLVLEPDKPLQTEFSAASLTPEHLNAAKELQGNWKTIAYQSNGRSTPVQPGREVPVTFDGNMQITVNPVNPRQEIEYRLDPTKSPKQFDQRFTGGTMGPWIASGIYKLERGTLTICHGGPNIARPDEFTTSPGDGRSIQILKRAE